MLTSSSRPTRRRRLLGVVAVGVLLAAGCGGDDDSDDAATTTTAASSSSGSSGSTTTGGNSDDAALDTLVDAAKQEGKVTFYTTSLEAVVQPVADAFEDEYGIDVSFQRFAAPDLVQRYNAEADSSGTNPSDIVILNETAFIRDSIANGNMIALDEADIPGWPGDYPEEFLIDGGAQAVAGLNLAGIGVNTQQVAEADRPATMEDVLDPQWKGKIVVPNPATSGDTYWQFWDYIDEEYGDDFLTAFAAQDPAWTDGGVPATQALAAGEYSIQMTTFGPPVKTVQDAGAPVELIIPDSTYGAVNAAGLSAEAEHPNAARLFLHFLYSEQGTDLYTASFGQASPYGGDDVPSDVGIPREEGRSDTRKAELGALLGLD